MRQTGSKRHQAGEKPPAGRQMTGAQMVVQALIDQGVKDIFG